jgi:hypothetical protein
MVTGGGSGPSLPPQAAMPTTSDPITRKDLRFIATFRGIKSPNKEQAVQKNPKRWWLGEQCGLRSFRTGSTNRQGPI